jgi:hypothetical protein
VLAPALIAIVSVFAMHGLGPHHGTATGQPSSAAQEAMAPMAHSQQHGSEQSKSGHDGPPPQTLVALCAVIILVATTRLSRRYAIHGFASAPAVKLQEVRATPEPPVPRFRFVSS